jgi:hypothetical protein
MTFLSAEIFLFLLILSVPVFFFLIIFKGKPKKADANPRLAFNHFRCVVYLYHCNYLYFNLIRSIQNNFRGEKMKKKPS